MIKKGRRLGVMFGDMGHGTLMLFGALGLIAVEKEWCDPELETVKPSKL